MKNRKHLKNNNTMNLSAVSNFIKKHPILIGIQLVIMTLIVIYANNYYHKYAATLFTRAGVDEKKVKIEMYPKDLQATAGKEAKFTLVGSGNENKIGFVSLVVTFNPEELKLTGIDNVVLDKFLESLADVNIDDANKTGTINLLYGGKTITDLPDKSLQMSQLTFSVLKEANSEVKIDNEKSQIVFIDNQLAELESETQHVNSIPPKSPTGTEDQLKASPTGTPEEAENKNLTPSPNTQTTNTPAPEETIKAEDNSQTRISKDPVTETAETPITTISPQ